MCSGCCVERATLFCWVEGCARIYHYKCAVSAGAIVVRFGERVQLYCRDHLQFALESFF